MHLLYCRELAHVVAAVILTLTDFLFLSHCRALNVLKGTLTLKNIPFKMNVYVK